MLPVIKQNKKTIVYKYWLSETGTEKIVIPIEFIGWKYNYQQGRAKYFYVNGETSIGEMWNCIDERGEWVVCSFKHVIHNKNANTSLLNRKDPVFNQFEANLLIDSLSEWLNNHLNKRINPNKHLLLINKKHKERILKLTQIVKDKNNFSKEEKKVAFFILRHKESPTIATLRAVQKVRNEKAEIYNSIIQKINE